MRPPAPPPELFGKLAPAVPFRYHDAWNARERILSGEFEFLNNAVNLGRPVDWAAPGQSLLWQFNLHYFNYLHLLNREEQLQLCSDWVRANPFGETIGFHPYPTSLRIVNWCKSNLDDQNLLQSLYSQTSYLYRNLETYHPGNHLLENAKALIFAGSYFSGRGESRSWLAEGVRIYKEQTPLQLLSDGGYFERSPMYHAIMLEGYLDIINILPEGPDRRDFSRSAEWMADFLLSVTHPDGNISLFNDSTTEVATPTAVLVKYASDLLNYHAKKKTNFSDTGLFITETSDVYLIIDGGAIGPDFLPAHAHADIFSYELSVHGKRVVVDSGVFEYRPGEMRSYVRSTRAHNTVCVDDVDQAECWGSFRVARRYHPAGVSFYDDGRATRFNGRFEGYSKLIGDSITHHRAVDCDRERGCITVRDSVTGRGAHKVESLVHLHPEIEVEIQEKCVLLRHPKSSSVITVTGDMPSVEEGWYCPEFGLRIRNKVLVWGGGHSLPVNVSYTLSY